MKDNKLSKEKIRFQYGLTIVLILVYVVLGVVVFGKSETDDIYDNRLMYRLVNGEYSLLYNSYNVRRDIEGTKTLKGPEFDKFEEFMEYYDNYIRFVIYDEYDDYLNTNEHMEKKEEYFEKMVEIRDSSQYSENLPHYDYLLEKVTQEE